MAKRNSYIIIKCPECGNELQVGMASEMYTCPICNTEINILKAYAEQDDTELNEYNEGILNAEREAERRRKQKIKRILLRVVAPVVGVILVLYFSYLIFLVPYLDYNATRRAIKAGDFELALRAIEDMSYYKGDYKDLSQQKTLIFAYKSFENGNYEQGIQYVNSINGKVYASFDSDGGSIERNEEIINEYISTKPFKNGYTFDGWELEDFEVSFIKYEARIKLKAKYTMNNYAIIYDLDGGTAIGNSSKYKITDKVVIRNPIKNGYEFIGWTGTGISTPVKNLEFTNKYGDILLKANWKIVTYTLELDSRGGECEVDKLDLVLNQEFQLPIPEKKGYEFLGWFDGDNQYRDGIWGITSNMKLSAKWVLKEYSITYDLGGPSFEGKTSYNCEEEEFVLENAYKYGYTFLGWTISPENPPLIGLEIDTHLCRDIVAKAVFEEHVFKITIDPDGALVDKTVFDLGYESELELPTLTKEGYEFLGWNEKGHSEVYLSYIVPKYNDKDRTFYANWREIKYSIEYDYNGGSEMIGIKTNYTINEEVVLASGLRRTGYNFIGWSGTGIDGIEKNVVIPKGSTGNRSYKANWEEVVNIITLDPLDLELTQTVYNVGYNSEFELPTLSLNGYNFLGWRDKGDTESEPFYVLEKYNNRDRSLEPVFEIIQYSISYELNGASPILGIRTNYTIEDEIILPLNPQKPGYTFLGWSGTDIDGIQREVTITIGSTGNRSYVANWEEN